MWRLLYRKSPSCLLLWPGLDRAPCRWAFCLGREAKAHPYHRTRALIMRQLRFPFHPWRLVLVIVLWNALFAIDRGFYGVTGFGPFVILAVGALAISCFTAPVQKKPGSWLMRNHGFARRWRWLFWYVGLIMAFFCVLFLHRLLARKLGLQPLL